MISNCLHSWFNDIKIKVWRYGDENLRKASFAITLEDV